MLEGVQMSVKSRSAALFLLAAKLDIKPVISSGAPSVHPSLHLQPLQALLYLTKKLTRV